MTINPSVSGKSGESVMISSHHGKALFSFGTSFQEIG